MKSILSNSALLVSDKAIRTIVSLGTTAILARKMGPVDFGSFYYVISILSLFQIFSTLGLENFAIRDISRYPEKTRALLSNILTLRSLGSLVAVTASLLYGKIFAEEYLPLIFIGSISLLSMPLETGEFFFQSEYKIRRSIQIRIGFFLLGSIARIALAFSNSPLVFFIASWATEILLTNLMLFLRFRWNQSYSLGLGKNFEQMKSLITDSAPLVLFAFAGILAIKMDVLFVGYSFSKMEIGIYGLAVRLVELIYVLPLALAMSILPALSKGPKLNYQENSTRIQEVLTLSTWTGIVATLGIFFAAPSMIEWFYGIQYADSVPIVRIYSLVLPLVFSGSIRNSIWIAYHKEWTLALSTSVIVLFLPFVYYFLVPKTDLQSVAWIFVGTLGMINLVMSIMDPAMLKFQIKAFSPWNLIRAFRRVN